AHRILQNHLASRSAAFGARGLGSSGVREFGGGIWDGETSPEPRTLESWNPTWHPAPRNPVFAAYALGFSDSSASSSRSSTSAPSVDRADDVPRLRRGRMSYRLIISLRGVGLMWSRSAARFCTPPAASSRDSMSRLSQS